MSETRRWCVCDGLICVLLCLCGCSHKYYSVFVESQSIEELESLELSFVDSDWHFRFGGLQHGGRVGYGPCNPRTIPIKVNVAWKIADEQREQEVSIPQSIREKIKGKGEDLVFRIGENMQVEVYVKLVNPWDLRNPTYFPAEFAKNRDGNEKNDIDGEREADPAASQ